jgi:hypothetical protein
LNDLSLDLGAMASGIGHTFSSFCEPEYCASHPGSSSKI